MALPKSSLSGFIIGVLILAYLSTFVVFAILRVLWGVSIQRLWWTGLRHISFIAKEGIRVDIRGLRLSLHRPTFAQPTWISIVVQELKVTVDLRLLGSKTPKKNRWADWRNGSLAKLASRPSTPVKPNLQSETETESDETEEERSRTWEHLTNIKEKIKRLHRQIQWIRMFDFVATNSSVVILDVGSIELASFTMAVDTRRKTVDRSRLFQHRRAQSELQRPAEWIFTARGLLFSPQGKESSELLDHATLNVYGLLLPDIDGLRDASIALKLGRISLPYDDLLLCSNRVKHCRQAYVHGGRGHTPSHSFADIVEELDHPGSKDEAIVQTVSDSKEFFASILRGIQEVQFAISFIGMSKRIKSVERTSTPVYLNMSMKEVGLDLLRTDPKSPAHLTYFSAEDVAHQALLTAISISMGIDDGHEHPERLLYIPMTTAMVRSTLPSKTIQFSGERNATDRNTNILYANLVVTSPSIDFDPRHLPLMLTALKNRREHRRTPQRPPSNRYHLLSRLLPKASVKFSIHEPMIRVTLPCMDLERRKAGDFDLLISAFSSMSLDIESSHFPGGELHYSLASNLRITSHQLYYQTASNEKHNLLITDNLELRLQISAAPDVSVIANGTTQTFSVYLVRPEISEGVREILDHLRIETSKRHRSHDDDERPNFLRRLPSWLTHVNLQGSDFNFEVAGIDPSVSQKARGAALHLESWSAEYKADRHEDLAHRPSRRRAVSRSLEGDEIFLKPASPSPSRKRPGPNETDGRRLAIHTHGLEAFVVESAETWEPESFLALPRFEVAFTTSSDHQGAILHINSFTQQLLLQYSLYRHFAIGVATMVLRKTFGQLSSASKSSDSSSRLAPPIYDRLSSSSQTVPKPEIVSIDFRAGFLQLKAAMPADPPLMIQVFGMEAGKHRWSAPFAKARLARLYAEAPNLKRVWARVLSFRTLRVDYRRQRRKVGSSFQEEKSFDVVADAIRVGIPHQLVVHKIFDNIVNVKKTVEQLHHRFKTGTEEYILTKTPEGPKHVPKVTLRTQAFLFEIEDSSFEWKLGLIYLQGLNEQKQRLAREQAFELKKKKIEEGDSRRGSNFRARSTFQTRGRHKRKSSEEVPLKKRSKSSDDRDRGRPHAPVSYGSRRLRYDAEGTCGLSDSARRTIEDAQEKLHHFNAQSWKKRINAAYRFQTSTMRDIRSLVWGLDDIPEEVEQQERILSIPQRPALMAVLISDLNITIDKSSFPINDYANFLHRIGKGMPQDMKYSLLIPMHLNIAMGEARITLRDYPLPALHVPAIRAGQSPRNPSLSLTTNFVIAEEFRNNESMRHVQVVVVPPERYVDGERQGGLTVDVWRTVSAVKTYSEIGVEINTTQPTRITWGTSYQPAIQDMMQVVENFTKPAVDPSERVGFWDKIRLSFHSKVRVTWKGDGDVHLILKGSRDPYHVTGSGAGFVMCWRNDVRWNICQDPDPRKFMTVDSGEYVLAIPDFSNYARRSLEREIPESGSVATSHSYEQGGKFKKTMMKLSGNVQWIAGLVFERNTEDGKRSFSFKPHYEVIMKNPDFARPGPHGEPYDAFRGFRSHHIHLSVGISAPVDRDWSVTNLKPSTNYNSVHLSPRSFSHFFDWWSMFQGNMSLPIRQGPIWPGPDKSSKKFGRHLATIKYNLLLSPLYLSHIYKHKDQEDYGQNGVSATGLKIKLDSFMLDLHQRREEFRQQIVGGSRQSKTTGMRINQAQLDFISADVRAVSQTIKGTTTGDVEEATEETLASYEQAQSAPQADLSCFTIPDNDTDWVDMDDFVELDWILPAESNPETKILPLAFAPRFTYFRQTDHHNVIDGDPMRSSPFGNEPTHFCVMSARNDPRRVQCDLIQERLDRLAEQIAKNKHTIGEHELQVVRDGDAQPDLRKRLQAFQEHHETLLKKQKFLQAMHKVLLSRLEDGNLSSVVDVDDTIDEFFEAHEVYDPMNPEVLAMDTAPLGDDISDFNNRFILHNTQFKWNNSLRNIILRYIHQVSQRRGFVYYMSRRAVKFILDIVEEQQNKLKAQRNFSYASQAGEDSLSPQMTMDDDFTVQDRIEQIINDGKQFVDAEEAEMAEEEQKPAANPSSDEISREFTSQNAYHFRLVAPQIQLQSEKDKKSAVLVTAKSMQLKVVQVMDKDRITDDVSGLVQRRFNADMQSVQVFVTNSKTFSSDFLDMYSANRYGTKASSAWPPWVPLEVMFDFTADPYGFSRVVQKTGAILRLDKFNTLRLKYNDDVTKGEPSQSNTSLGADENRMDHLWVDFPKLLAVCDSAQYYALYIIVLDLLLYSEPLEKTRSERLEKIMLASDFSDLSGAPEMVVRLQEKIRTLQEIKMFFQINEKTLSRQQWKERIMLEQDLTSCEDELFFIMKAITTSQRKLEDRVSSSEATPLLRWNIKAESLVWHLVRTKEESLVELQLNGAVFDRIDNNDGSNDNTMQIERIEGWNLLPNAIYPQIMAPYEEKDANFDADKSLKMVWVHWYMLEAIAGIPVMETFEVKFYPLKLQFEHEVGMKIFEYVFPGMSPTRPGKSKDGDSSPFMIKHVLPSTQEEDEHEADEITTGNSSPSIVEATADQSQSKLTGAGDLSLRLQPTLTLPDNKRYAKSKMFHSNSHSDLSRLKHGKLTPWGRKDASADHLRPEGSRQNSNLSATSGKKDLESVKHFSLRRTNSDQSKTSKQKERSDDLTEMLGRASKYMTLAFVKVESMVLCLSYKGKGSRNLEDVHDLVFRMPALEYRNKTWSNYDLFMQLRREVLKALVGHTGAIIGNKFHRRANKQEQSRLREIANSSIILGPHREGLGISSETTSMRDFDTESEPRPSFTSGRPDSEWSAQYSFNNSSHSQTPLSGTPFSGTPTIGTPSIHDRQSGTGTPNGRPWTSGAMTPALISESGTQLAGPPRPPSSHADSERAEMIKSSLGRRLTSLSQRAQSRDGTNEDSEDSRSRRKLALPKFLQRQASS